MVSVGTSAPILRAEDTVATAADYIRERAERSPRIGIILGSGLGGVAEAVDEPTSVAFDELPGFPKSSVPGHAGRLVLGQLENQDVAILQGRFHLYEGVAPASVALPVRVLSELGIDTLLLTNAAGGIRPGLTPGSLMLISDHINLMFRNPLIGKVYDGDERFPDMSNPYDRDLRALAREVAVRVKIDLAEGVYAAMLGPSFETPAEIRMLSRMGADAVGMSTVPEVVAARARGIRVLGISMISNLAAGISNAPLNHEEVLEMGKTAGQDLERLLRELLREIGPADG